MPSPVFNIKWRGLPQAVQAFSVEFNSMVSDFIKVVELTGNKIADRASKSLRKGQYKAFRTGDLSRAHTTKLIKATNRKVESRVDNTKSYAYPVHDGTKKMKGRPWLRAAVNSEEAGFIKRLKRVAARKGLAAVDQGGFSFNSSI